MNEPDAARVVARFTTALRRRGLEVPSQSAVLYAEGLAAVGLADRSAAYWAGRACLVRTPEDERLYDEVFGAFFEQCRFPEPTSSPPLLLSDDENEKDGAADGAGKPVRAALTYSSRETLREKDFARYDQAEWSEARRLIALMSMRTPTRRSRQQRSAARGRSLDLPRTVQRALRTDGEAMYRSFSRAVLKPRRLIFLIDISGSMEPYVRAFLRFSHSSLVARPAGEVEVFAFATRVSRLTRRLGSRDPDLALSQVAGSVEDWFGGTRLGEGIRGFNDRFGLRGLARGAIVVILSDGWDRGDPGELAREMGRLTRVANRVVWANPLRASPGYEPLAKGMAAALPHVDDFVDAHSLAALEELARLLVDGRPSPRAVRLARATRREAPCG